MRREICAAIRQRKLVSFLPKGSRRDQTVQRIIFRHETYRVRLPGGILMRTDNQCGVSGPKPKAHDNDQR